MSNYVVLTNYAAKDALISGNPLKLIKGADFTAEFNAVAVAVATKIDGTLVFAPDGTAGQPSYGFTNNAGTGAFNAAGVLGLATGSATRISINAAGAVTVNAPTAGVAATINALATQATLILKPGDSASVGLQITDPGGNATQARINTTNSAVNIQALGTTTSLNLLIGANPAIQINSSGAVTLPAPTAGNALTVNALASGGSTSTVQIFSGAVADSPSVAIGRNSATDGIIGISSSASVVLTGATVGDLCLRGNSAGVSIGGGSTMRVRVVSGVVVGAATGGDQGAGTINATGHFINGVNMVQTGTFTGTLTGGVTGTPTATFNYTIVNGTQATIDCNAGLLGTSTTTGNPVITGVPALLQPARQMGVSCPIEDNTTTAGGFAIVGTTGSIGINKYGGVAWTAAGSKGLPGTSQWSITYNLV